MRAAVAGLIVFGLGASVTACDGTVGPGGAGGGGAGGGSGGSFQGNGGGVPQGEKPRQNPPANVVGGFKVELPQLTLEPGDERYPCYIAPLELSGPSRVVGGGVVTVGKGMHHGNITARPKTGDGFRSCPPDTSPIGGEASDILNGGAVLFGSTTQLEGTEYRTFPDGMGFPIGDEWEIVFRMHYLNPTTEPTTLAPTYEWFTIDESTVTHLLGPFIWRYSGFEIPPFGEETVTADCYLPGDTYIVDVMPHMHKLGTRFFASVLGGPNDGELFIDSPGYNPDGVIRTYDPPLDLSAADGFSWGCTWQNTFDKPIVEGVGDDEMCMLFGYAYPYEHSFSAVAAEGGACVIVFLPPPPT